MYCGHMLLAFAYCLFVVPLVLYSVVGIQDSQGDQPMADGTFLVKIKIHLSIYLSNRKYKTSPSLSSGTILLLSTLLRRDHI